MTNLNKIDQYGAQRKEHDNRCIQRICQDSQGTRYRGDTPLYGRYEQRSPALRVFPPFYADFGKNITVGEGVFINACCHFQDHGGVIIGDGCQIGHNVVFATLNHGLAQEDRQTTYPAPIVLGKDVWIGSNATILQGVTIGDNAVVGAGAVVMKDVEANTIVGGVPARFIKSIVKE